MSLAEKLPDKERFVLVPQIRRAALSITNNFAEGHGSRSYKHNVSYLYRSRGSINELIDDLNTCEDLSYFNPDHLADLKEDARDVIRVLNGYIRHLKNRLKNCDTD